MRCAFAGAPAPRWVIAAVVLGASGAAEGQEARRRGSRATMTHTVVEGETLAQIARDHGIAVSDLLELNDITAPDRIRIGQEIRIPETAGTQGRESGEGDRDDASGAGRGSRAARVTRRGVVLYVADGQTLSDIANSYGVSVAAVARASGIEDADAVRVGQRVLVPGAGRVVEVRRVRRDPWAGWSRPITFHRVHTDEEITVRLFDPRGRVRPETRRQVDRIMRYTPTGRGHRIHADLLKLIQRVADHWPDRKIRIWSGYRPRRRDQYTPKSNHNVGRALDLTVEGVSNEELRAFCRSLPAAGVGYYPNSRFVHLDARERRAYWVDYSRPGEAPRYGREGAGDPGRVDPEARSDREARESGAGDEGAVREPEGEEEEEGSERLGRELPAPSEGR